MLQYFGLFASRPLDFCAPLTPSLTMPLRLRVDPSSKVFLSACILQEHFEDGADPVLIVFHRSSELKANPHFAGCERY